MNRCLVIIAAVAGISYGLAQLDYAQGERSTWVRTADGWEPSGVLRAQPRPLGTPTLHPLLVATFQLGASLFVLLAFPSGEVAAGRAGVDRGGQPSPKRASLPLHPHANT